MKEYNIYATLLDAFQNYLDSDKIYNRYWGNSENPPHTPKEFEQLQYQAVIDRINRVPFDSDAADRGTCFNEAIDMVNGQSSGKISISGGEDTLGTMYNNKTFVFSLNDIQIAANRYKDAMAQVYCDGYLEFDDYKIKLYGYIDELFSDKIVDIKTTGRTPEAFGFINHWQHRVYPFCVGQMGAEIDAFEYHHYTLNDKHKVTSFMVESYPIDQLKIRSELINICTLFTQFIEYNLDKITDKKILNL